MSLGHLLLDYLLDRHSHKCPLCDFVWEHLGDSGGVDWAHRCPKCRAEQFTRYDGPKPPQAFFGIGTYSD